MKKCLTLKSFKADDAIAVYNLIQIEDIDLKIFNLTTKNNQTTLNAIKAFIENGKCFGIFYENKVAGFIKLEEYKGEPFAEFSKLKGGSLDCFIGKEYRDLNFSTREIEEFRSRLFNKTNFDFLVAKNYIGNFQVESLKDKLGFTSYKIVSTYNESVRKEKLECYSILTKEEFYSKQDNSIKWLFFDIGSTLVDEEKCIRKRCHEQALTIEAKDKNLDEEQLYQEIILASKNYEPQYKAVVDKFHLSSYFPYDNSLEILFKDVKESLKNLSKKYKLGIIANQSEGLAERLKKFGIGKYFSIVVGSYDVGYHKPDFSIFYLALYQTRTKAKNCVMIGDRLDNDIYPAKKINMKTIWIKRGFGKYQTPKSEEYMPDLAISSLLEIYDAIIKLEVK